MKRFVATGFAFALLVVAVGCSGSATTPPALMKGEAEVQDAMKLMNEMADAMEKKDEAKVKTLKEKLDILDNKMKELKLPEEEEKKLKDKYKGEMDKLQERMMKAAAKGLGVP